MNVDASIVSRFLDQGSQTAALMHRAEGPEALRAVLAGIIEPEASVYCPARTEQEQVAAAAIGRLVPDYPAAQVTVEEVAAAIAETGSIVCTSQDGKAVQASLLPSQHVAIVPRDKIFATLDDFFVGLAGAVPTNLAIITGPSRTADIELNLVIGVHGPERLDIIVV